MTPTLWPGELVVVMSWGNTNSRSCYPFGYVVNDFEVRTATMGLIVATEDADPSVVAVPRYLALLSDGSTCRVHLAYLRG